MITLSKAQALRLHQMVAEASGGSVGLRDEGLLESALESIWAGFGGQAFYPTVEEKGARLGYALIANHAFVDGNKRIGVLMMLTFLALNGAPVRCTDAELADMGLAVAAGTMSCEDLLRWVLAHRG